MHFWKIIDVHIQGDGKLIYAKPETIIEFLSTHNTMAVGTCGSDKPVVGWVFYIADGLNIYFSTYDTAMKMRHIKKNPNVGIAIDHGYVPGVTPESSVRQLQVFGTAEILDMTNPDHVVERRRIIEKVVAQFPEQLGYHDLEGVSTLRVTPRRFVYTDFDQGVGARQTSTYIPPQA